MDRLRAVASLFLFSAAIAVPSAAERQRAVRFTPSGLAAVPDSYAARKGDAVTIDATRGVLANDLEPAGRPLIAMTVTLPEHGSLTFRSNGSFTYTHDGSEGESDSFSYKVSNGSDQSAPARVTLAITKGSGVTGIVDTYLLAHGATLVVPAPGLLGNDTAPAGATMSAAVATAPLHGRLTLDAGGGFAYAHGGGSNTRDSFTYRVTANGSSSAPVTVTLLIASNAAPSVANQSYTATQNTPLSVAAPGVLTGATDPDSAQLTAVLATQPQHGTIVLNPDGSFVYTAAIGYFGSDTFTYRASDGIATSLNTGTAFITVAGAPVANADTYSASTATPLTIAAPGVLNNDVTAGAGIRSYGAMSGLEQPIIGAQTPTARGGMVSLTSGGGFTYNPPPAAVSTDSFAYVIGNAAGSTLAIVTINLFAKPSATSDAYDVAAGMARSVAAPGVLANDVVNGATILSNSAPSHGTVTLNADGSFVYTPAPAYTGTDAFSYTIGRTAGSATATVALRVLAAPVAVADAYTNSSGTLTPAYGVLQNDAMNFAAIAGYGVKGTEQSAAGNATATAQGGLVVVSPTGTVTYVPPPNFAGTDTFRYTLANYAGTSSAAVTISTYAQPLATSDTYAVARNGTRSVSAPGVLANDAVNGATIVSYGATRSAQQTNIGTRTTTQSGGTILLDEDGSFAYDAPTNFTGSDSFVYQLANPTFAVYATVTLTIASPPAALADTYSTPPSSILTVRHDSNVFRNDLTNDAVVMSYGATSGTEQSVVGLPAATAKGGLVALNADGTFVYTTPPASFTGNDTFLYVLGNPAGQSTAVVTIVVSTTPVPVDDAYTVPADRPFTAPAPGILVNDGTSLSVASYGKSGNERTTLGAPAETTMHGSVVVRADGGFTYTPPAVSTATDSFRYTVAGAAGTSIAATVALHLAGVPVARNDAYAATVNTTLAIAATDGVTANDIPNGATIASYGKTGIEQTSLGHSTATAAGGTVSLSANGGFAYSPALHFSGNDTFAYVLSSAAGNSMATVQIGVGPIPIATADSYSVARHGTRSVSAPGVLANDTTNGGTIVSFGKSEAQQSAAGTAASTAAGGTVSLNADGSFHYTAPSSSTVGIDAFVYRLQNNSGSSYATVTLSIAVPPAAQNDTYRSAAGATLHVADTSKGLLANDTPAGVGLTSYGAATGAEQSSLGATTATSRGGLVSVLANGTFTYHPPAGFTGADAFKYVIGNGAGTSTATVEMQVVARPAAAADFYSVAAVETRTIAAPGVLANDTANTATIVRFGKDMNNATAVPGATVATAVAGATVTLHEDGSFTYSRTVAHIGTDSFIYRLENAAGAAYGTVTLAVGAPPGAESDHYDIGIDQTLSRAAGDGLLHNDRPTGGTIVSYGAMSGTEQSVAGIATATAHAGTITVYADGAFLYKPPTSFTGTDSFQYVTTNSAGSSSATVQLVVIAKPAAAADFYSVASKETRVVAAPGVLANDTPMRVSVVRFGKDLNSLTAAPGATSPTAVAGATITLHHDGSFTYARTADHTGNDSFAYEIANVAGSARATVTFSVAAPPAAANDHYETGVNLSLSPHAADGVLKNDAPSGGSVVSYGAKSGSEQTTIGIPTPTLQTGTVTVYADGAFLYNPPPGYSGTDAFHYVMKSSAGTSSATVQIAIVAPPVAAGETYSVAKNTTHVVAAPGVLANDTQHSAVIRSAGRDAAHQFPIGPRIATAHGGEVTLRADGGFEYRPASNFTGVDTFVYMLENAAGRSHATVTFSVAEPLGARDDSYETVMNAGPLTISMRADGVLRNDLPTIADVTSYGKTTGTEQQTLGMPTATAKNGTVSMYANGTFVYTPPAQSFTGTDSFRYAMKSTNGTSAATVTLTIRPIAEDVTFAVHGVHEQRAPGILAGASGYKSFRYGRTGTEADEQVLTATESGGTVKVNSSGAFEYVAPSSPIQTDTFHYRVFDASGVASRIAKVTLRLARIYAFSSTGDYFVQTTPPTSGPSWSHARRFTNVATDGPPQEVVFDEHLYAFYLVGGTNGTIGYTRSPDGDLWMMPTTIQRLHSKYAPSPVAFNGKLLLFFVNEHQELTYVVQAGLHDWSAPVVINTGAAVISRPTAIEHHGRLHVFYRSTNDKMWYVTSSDGTTWPYELNRRLNADGMPNETGFAAAVGRDTLHLFYVGHRPDNAAVSTMHVASTDGGTWTASEQRAMPTATLSAANFGSDVYLFFRFGNGIVINNMTTPAHVMSGFATPGDIGTAVFPLPEP